MVADESAWLKSSIDTTVSHKQRDGLRLRIKVETIGLKKITLDDSNRCQKGKNIKI